jgi:hypothetical protein
MLDVAFKKGMMLSTPMMSRGDEFSPALEKRSPGN